jgi:Ca2+-binding RTX toxin-like protein
VTQPFEYALLSGDAYRDAREFRGNYSPVPPGWTELTKYAISGSGANASFPGSGFSARVYRDVTGEIVIAYAGTQFGGSGAGQAGDWFAGNMPLAVGLLGPQAIAAAELYQRVAADLGNNITFTGHSLGGGLAAMMAVYFDRPAKVFAPAPFGKSADPTQYALGVLGPLAAIRAKLFANALAEPHLVGIPEALADFSPGGDYTARSAKVQAWAVKGEILEKTLFLLPFIETSGTRTSLFTAGETELGMTSKHSIDLHAAGLMSPTFNKWAAVLTGALPLIFDRTFYAVDLITGDKQDFLVKLNRNQVGIAETAPNGMLSHFANDLQKMGVNIAGLNRTAQDALTAQSIEWYYWQGRNYAGQEFFTQTGNLLQYTSAQGAGLDGAPNKAVRYVDPWLNPIASAHGTFSEVVNYDQWNVVIGSEGATAAARDSSKTQIFIGGAGSDSLTGGNSADTFYAGEGNDTLDGGAGTDMLAGGGGVDIYQFSGAFGSDTIVDSDGLGSIEVEGGTLQGGKKVEGLENVWRNGEQGYTFALAGSGADRSLRITKDGTVSSLQDLIAMMPLATAPDLHTGYFRTYTGTAGADKLAGTTGIDILNGGAGDDLYTISDEADMAQEDFNEGFDTAVSTVDYTIRAHIENLILTGPALKGTGNALGNTLIGNRGDNQLTGGFGADTLIGGDGDDMLDGPAGDDASTVWITMTSDSSAVYTVYGSPAVPLAVTNNMVPGAMPGGSLRFEGGISGSARIYVTPGSQVDLGNVGMNGGSVYLSGKFADYSQVVDQNTGIYTFRRESPGGQSERLEIKAFNMDSSLYFADGCFVLNSSDSRLVSVTSNVNPWEWTRDPWGWGYENLYPSQETRVFEPIQAAWLTAGEQAWPVDIPVISQGADRLVGGLGNDLYFVDEAGDAVVENAGEGSDTVQSCLASYTLGANVENLTLLGDGNTSGTGNALANVLRGNAGNNILAGGHGGDTYQAGRGMGEDRIVENDATPGTIDVLSFGAEISANQLWMRRIGNDLEINIIGSADKAAVQDWYLGSAHHVEQIRLSDGKLLLDSDLDILVQAMASFAPPAMGQTDLPAAYAAQLAPVIAASWH